MTGSIVKKGARWYIIIEQRDPETGERKRKWHSGFRTKKEAEAARTDLLSRMQRGLYVEPSKDRLADYLMDQWLPAIESTVRRSTFVRYRNGIRLHVIPYLGNVPLQEITPSMLNGLYSKLLVSGRADGGGGLAPNTVRNAHVVLHKALNDAVRWGLLSKNPSEFADPPRVPMSTTMRIWNADEVRAFLDSTETDRLQAAWVLAATTGMRRGEILGLRWDDIDLEARRLAVRRALVTSDYELSFSPPKTARGRRVVALDPETVRVMRKHRVSQAEERLAMGDAYRDQDLVFCQEDGSPVHPDRFTKIFKNLVSATGLPSIRLHDVRHSYATLALEAGVHPKVVSERLGHASIGITLDTYSHVLPSLQEEAAETVAAVIFNGG